MANNQCSTLFNAPQNNLLRVAAVQYAIRSNQNEDEFLQRIRGWVESAKAQNADLVVFPELITLDLLRDRHPLQDAPQLQNIARDFSPRYFEWVTQLARELKISILAGSTPRLVNEQIYNTAFLAFPDGRSVMQDKNYLTPDEITWGWQPGNQLQVFDAPWGRTVILICFDCEFPIISNSLAQSRPEVILVPSMTSDASGLRRVQWSSQTRAVEHYAYVVNTGTVSGNEDYLYTGQASLMTPQEIGFPPVLSRGEQDQEQMIVGELNLDYLRERRATAGIYPAREQSGRQPPQIITPPR